MFGIILLILLALGFYTGYKRGFLLEVFYSLGYLLVYWTAKANYKELADHLDMYVPYPAATTETKLVFFDQELIFELDKPFYAAIAFLIILFAGWLAIRVLGVFLHGLVFLPLFKQADGIIGGSINAIIVFVVLALVLNMLTLIPVPMIQDIFKTSGLARFMVENTPIISNQVQELWIKPMLGQ